MAHTFTNDELGVVAAQLRCTAEELGVVVVRKHTGWWWQLEGWDGQDGHGPYQGAGEAFAKALDTLMACGYAAMVTDDEDPWGEGEMAAVSVPAAVRQSPQDLLPGDLVTVTGLVGQWSVFGLTGDGEIVIVQRPENRVSVEAYVAQCRRVLQGTGTLVASA